MPAGASERAAMCVTYFFNDVRPCAGATLDVTHEAGLCVCWWFVSICVPVCLQCVALSLSSYPLSDPSTRPHHPQDQLTYPPPARTKPGYPTHLSYLHDELHLYGTFLTSGHTKRFIILRIYNIHPHIHTPTTLSTTQGANQLVGSS